MALQPALAANSAPEMKVPEPIHVQIRVNTIFIMGIWRPASIISSWVLTLRDFQKFMMVKPAR
jgi:hypothetical protein